MKLIVLAGIWLVMLAGFLATDKEDANASEPGLDVVSVEYECRSDANVLGRATIRNESEAEVLTTVSFQIFERDISAGSEYLAAYGDEKNVLFALGEEKIVEHLFDYTPLAGVELQVRVGDQVTEWFTPCKAQPTPTPSPVIGTSYVPETPTPTPVIGEPASETPVPTPAAMPSTGGASVSPSSGLTLLVVIGFLYCAGLLGAGIVLRW